MTAQQARALQMSSKLTAAGTRHDQRDPSSWKSTRKLFSPRFTKIFGNKTSLSHDSHASGRSFGMCFWGGVSWGLAPSLPSAVRAPEKRELAHTMWVLENNSQGWSRRVWRDRLEGWWVLMFTSLFGVLYVRHLRYIDGRLMTSETG
jgi:hypothetical protein